MGENRERKKAILEENKNIRRLRFCTDLTYALIAQGDLSIEEAYQVIESLKKVALTLFPGKETTFDLIYGSRFKRLLMEKYQMH